MGCAAGVGFRPSAAGSGPAAHRGPDCRCRVGVTDSRCSCAADGGPTVVVSHGSRLLRSRAGYRSAQDFDAFPLPSNGSFRATDGGTVGGSPDDHSSPFLVAADCGAGWWWWRRWRSLRFTPKTEFYSVWWSRSSYPSSDCRANRCHSSSSWCASRFSS